MIDFSTSCAGKGTGAAAPKTHSALLSAFWLAMESPSSPSSPKPISVSQRGLDIAMNLLILPEPAKRARWPNMLEMRALRLACPMRDVLNAKTPADPKTYWRFWRRCRTCEYLEEEAVTHVIDATHPFAVQMSRNAVDACAIGTPLWAGKAPLAPKRGDFWSRLTVLQLRSISFSVPNNASCWPLGACISMPLRSIPIIIIFCALSTRPRLTSPCLIITASCRAVPYGGG